MDSNKIPHQVADDWTYRGPSGYGMSESLKRARKIYRARNLVTGAIMFSIVCGSFAYTLKAMSQDDFSDLDEKPVVLRGGKMANDAMIEQKKP